MKKAFLNKSISLIKKNNPNFNETEILRIKYGLEAIYLTIFKFIIIFIICLIVGIVKEFILFTVLYNIIRLFAFGIHASKSSICLFFSLLAFVALPYFSVLLPYNIYFNIIAGVICIIMMILYAPADTHKRPLIKLKKRQKLKKLSIITSIIYVSLSLISKNNFIANCFIFSLLLETIIILPITYKIFKMPYNNYKNYKSGGNEKIVV